MALLLNKFYEYSRVVDDWSLSEIHANHWNKVSYFLLPNNFLMNYCHEWLNFAWGDHLISDSNCNTRESIMPDFFLTRNDLFRLYLVFGDTTWASLHLVLSKTNRIGHTKGYFTHEIECMWPMHSKAMPIPLEVDCMKFQAFLGWRPASTTHYNKITTRATFFICKGHRAKKLGRFHKSSIIQRI